MSMPPKDIAPADLWTQVTAVPRGHRVMDFPRKGADGLPVCRVAMVVLTQEEQMKCNVNISAFLRKYVKDNGAQIPNTNEQDFAYKNLYEMQVAIEVLYCACKNPDDITKPFFPTKNAIAQSLLPSEIAILFKNYARVQTELGPILSQMSAEEMDAWIEVFVKGGSEFPLDSLSLDGVTGLLMHMASQLYNLQKDKSSHITPPSDIIEVE